MTVHKLFQLFVLLLLFPVAALADSATKDKKPTPHSASAPKEERNKGEVKVQPAANAASAPSTNRSIFRKRRKPQLEK